MRVFVIDEQILFRECLVKAIDSQPDFKIIGQAGSIHEGIELALNLHPDVVLLGVEPPCGTGLEAIEEILCYQPDTKIIMLSLHESDEILFAAIRHGAQGFIPKNIPLDHLFASLRGLQRNEPALSRVMTSRILREFMRLGRMVNNGNLDGLDALTGREVEILEQLGNDATNEEIATRLMISRNTVKVHISHILDKLSLRNRHEAGNFARRHGIIPTTSPCSAQTEN